jgi:hypothetical protein
MSDAALTYTSVFEAADVTGEILGLAERIFDGWFADGRERIDWHDFLDRLDGATLDDESTLDLGTDLSSPAIVKIKAHVREYRRE